MFLAQELLPVDPPTQKVPVVAILAQDYVRHSQQHRGLGTWPGRKPVVGLRGSVGEARVDHAYLCTSLFGLHDSLGVRIEIMPGLKMRAEQQNEARVGVVGGRSVVSMPERVPGARSSRAHVGVAVVPVDAPRVKDALVVDEFVARPAHVVHNLVAPIFQDSAADAGRDVIECRVPAHPLPLALTAFSCAAKRITKTLSIFDLVKRRGSLRAIPSLASRVFPV